MKSLNELIDERENVLKIKTRHQADLDSWKGLRLTPHLRRSKLAKQRTIKKLQDILDQIDKEIESASNGESTD